MRRPAIVAATLAIAAGAVYVRTLARSLYFGDSPELAMAAAEFGVPHPTGYPLYVILGGAFLRIVRWGSVAHRMNLFSAICAAFAVAGVYRLAFLLSRKTWAAMCAAVFYAVSLTFWSQATVAEVYALHVALTVWALCAALEWKRTRRRTWLYAASGLFGASLANHLTALALAPALAVAASGPGLRPPVPRALRARCALLLAAPLLLYLQLPLAAWRDPVMNWGDTRTVGRFVEHVTAAQYRYRMHVPTPASIWHGVVDYAGWPEEHKRPGYLLSEFSIAVVWLGPLGLLHLARRHRRMLWISVLAYSGPVAYTFVYEIPDIHVYYLVPHALLAAWLACGLRIIAYTLRRGLRRVHLPGGSRRRLMALFSAGWLGLAVMAGSVNLRATDLSRDRVADGFAASILGRMAPAALVLTTGDDWSFPLLYARHVEGARQDVLVLPAVFFLQRNYRLVTRLRREGLEVVDPECARRARDPDAHIWCRLRHVASRNLARRPVYLIGPTVEEFVRNHAESDRWPPYARVAEGVPVLRFRAPEVGDASRRRHADHGSDGHSP